MAGWWFGTYLFSHILGIIIPIDFHIFQRGSIHQPDGIWGYHFRRFPSLLIVMRSAPASPSRQVKEAAQFTDDVMQAMAEKLGVNVMAPRPRPRGGSTKGMASWWSSKHWDQRDQCHTKICLRRWDSNFLSFRKMGGTPKMAKWMVYFMENPI